MAITEDLPKVWRPPMGWNSWDSYGTTVTESEVLANATIRGRLPICLTTKPTQLAKLM